MTRQIVLRAPPYTANRRQQLLDGGENSSRGGSRMGEAVGGAAAVCCCCPCGLVELLVLAVYKVPAGLCRKALRGKQRRKKGLLPARGVKCGCGGGDGELFHIHPLTVATAIEAISVEFDKEVAELEKEMWDRFYGAGFWRSPSQRTEFMDSSSDSRVAQYKDRGIRKSFSR